MKNNSVLIERIKNGDESAKNLMVEENIRLAEKIAVRFRNRGYDYEEIVQVGVIGLIKAVEKYNPEFNTQFSTYAYPVIEGEIKRFLRDNGAVKVSRRLKELAMKGKKAGERLTDILGREPTISEIAQHCGVETEEMSEAFSASDSVKSIYENAYNSGESEVMLLDTLEDVGAEDRIINRVLINEIISLLDKKERQIIVLRYFKEKTQSETAEIIGISQVQVSRIEKKIIERLRKKMN